jgi:hypothetical protein
VRTPKAMSGTYHVGVRYFNAGPMGISRGVVIVTRGGDVEVHPFRNSEDTDEQVIAIDRKAVPQVEPWCERLPLPAVADSEQPS